MKRLTLGLAAFWLACVPSFAAKKPVPPAGDVVLIVNTGSTNTAGYHVSVPLAGAHKGFAVYTPTKGGASGEPGLEEQLPEQLVQKLRRDLRVAMPLASLPTNHVLKSVSFGTSTYVQYEGQQTSDLSSPADARGQALAADIKNIMAILNVNNIPRVLRGAIVLAPSPDRK